MSRSSLRRTAHLLFVLWVLCLPAAVAEPPPAPYARWVEVYVFSRDGCPHCEKEIGFLASLAERKPAVRVHVLEVTRNRANAALLETVGTLLRADVSGVPFTVVGDEVFIGYLSDATTGRELESRIEACLAHDCPDSVQPVLPVTSGAGAPASAAPAPTVPAASEAAVRRRLPETLELPLIGEVATATLSLPALTVMLAALDGFNPCAMWVLVFLLGLLAGLKDRRRMWLLGGAFVAASAAVYFVFLAAWLNVLLFLGTLTLIRLAIGVVALGGGVYYLREFMRNAPAHCEVTRSEERQRVFARLRELSQRRELWLALGGVVLLAFAVNIVELLCSAGIPAVYTQVLALSELPRWQHYAYLVLYILVFMADDLVVLAAALATLQVTGLTGRYARWSNLIGGVVLLAIGALLLFKPEWLVYA
jgi:glutaredoxin